MRVQANIDDELKRLKDEVEASESNLRDLKRRRSNAAEVHGWAERLRGDARTYLANNHQGSGSFELDDPQLRAELAEVIDAHARRILGV
jgi:hypothetical protein